MQEKLTEENKKQLLQDENGNNIPDILENSVLDEKNKTGKQLMGPYLLTQLLSRVVRTDRLKEKVARAEGKNLNLKDYLLKLVPFFIMVFITISAFAFAHFYLHLF